MFADEAPIPRARELAQTGECREALSILEAMQADSPASPAGDQAAARAEALMCNGDYQAAVAPAQAAVEAAAGATAGPRADALLLLARAEILAGVAYDGTLKDALQQAVAADGEHGLRVLRVEDRVALVLSSSNPAEAERIMRGVLAEPAAGIEKAARDRFRFLNTLGIALQREAKYDPSRQAFEEALQGRQKLLSERHAETAESFHNLGVAYRRLNMVDAAKDAFAHAMQIRIELLGVDHPDTLTTRMMGARQLYDKGDFVAAIAEATAVSEAMRRRLGSRDPRTFEAEADLGRDFYAAGRRSEGLRTFKQAFQEAQSALNKNALETLNIGHEYAGLLSLSGRLGDALTIYQRVLVSTRQVFDDKNRDTIATLHGLATVLSDLGRGDDAIAAERYVLSVLDAEVPPAHPSRLSVLNNLATALLTSGRPSEALTALDEVVERRRTTLGPEHPLTLLSRSSRAAALDALKRFDEAEKEHREILAIRRRLVGDKHPDTVKSMHNLAATLADAGDLEHAVTLFEEVLQLRKDILSPTDIDTIKTMWGLADVLERSGRRPEAERILEEMVGSAEELRTEGGLPDTLRRSLFATVVPAYKSLAVAYAREGRFDDAFRMSQLSKARTLIETSSGRGVARSLLTPEERGALSDLEFRIAQLDRLIPTIKEAAEKADAEARRSALSREFQARDVEMKAQYPAYAAFAQVQPATVSELAGVLEKNGVLIDFLRSGDRLLVLWATADGRHDAAPLVDCPGLDGTVATFVAALSKRDGVDGLRYDLVDPRLVWRLPDGSFRMQSPQDGVPQGAKRVRDITEIRKALSALLLGGLPADVAKARRWYVSADGPLSLAPFETLSFESGLVLDNHELSYIFSPALLKFAHERKESYANLARSDMLAVGNPAYEPIQASAETMEVRPIDALRGPSGDLTRGHLWRNLPGTARELSALQSLFSLVDGESLFSGDAASEMTLQRLEATRTLARYKYLVFSTHGYVDPTYPELSGIVLSQINLAPGEDGYLRTAELSSFDLRSDLVFVSACDSGVGKVVPGEGVLGLPFALFAGGSANAALSLWSILDGDTAGFVGRYFAKLKAGIEPARALAETKREFLHGEAGAVGVSPAVWAAFVLYGS